MCHYRIASRYSGADYGVWHGVDEEDVLRQLYHAMGEYWGDLAIAEDIFAVEEIGEREAERLEQYCP